MSEIKVQAYVPDEDYDNPAMVTDFYEFTMANCLFLHGYKDTVMVFDMFFRENPDDQGYAISCGQHKLVKFLLEGVKATGTEIMVLITGCVVSFIVSLVVIRGLMEYVRKHSFAVFGIYRIALGGVVLIYFLIRSLLA